MEIANRPQIDAEAGTLMAQVMERHRVELIRLLGNPPDYDNVPLAFWQKIRREYEEQIAAILLLVFLESSRRHGYFEFFGESDTTARTQALLWSGHESRNVANAITQTTMERIERASERWRTGLENGTLTEEQVRQDAEDRVNSIMGPGRAQGIAEDQVTVAQSAGGEWTVSNTLGLSALDTWYTRHDNRVCEICDPLHGTVRAVWSAQFPKGPKAHPRCRCWIVYDNLKEQQ